MHEQDIGIGELVARVASELGASTRVVSGGATAYEREGVCFARVGQALLEVRLPEDIADAAMRTPDTLATDEGRGWVRFTPASIEGHVLDRAEAWFRTAWRHASEA